MRLQDTIQKQIVAVFKFTFSQIHQRRKQTLRTHPGSTSRGVPPPTPHWPGACPRRHRTDVAPATNQTKTLSDTANNLPQISNRPERAQIGIRNERDPRTIYWKYNPPTSKKFRTVRISSNLTQPEGKARRGESPHRISWGDEQVVGGGREPNPPATASHRWDELEHREFRRNPLPIIPLRARSALPSE